MREYKRQTFAQIGDPGLVERFVEDVLQKRVDSANQTLSNMAAQVISTGKIVYKYGQGIHAPVLKARIPEENFLKAGSKVWTDPNCPIIDIMAKIEEDVKNKTGLNIAWQWKFTKDMFKSIFLNNNQIKEWVRYYFDVASSKVLPESFTLTTEMVSNAISAHPAGLSPIVLVEEKQKDSTLGTVHGWKDGVVVFCPAGKLGLVRRTTIADLRLFSPEYTNPANSYVFGSTLDGCAVVRNSVIVNGNLKEWHSDLVLAATPTLDEFLYHYIVDTTATE